jgi:hypothetical protein
MMGKSSTAPSRTILDTLAASAAGYLAGLAYAARRAIIHSCRLAPPDPEVSTQPRIFHRLWNFCGYSALAV